ncbi:MAG TPA: hypothetical protein VGU22_12660 [Methylomirabilota bacterium]|jgi:hypothetical protein|nr:hypothetical protein [Methylomirabilota bacterium]
MRAFVAVAAVLVGAWFAAPASAFVVEVTTSVAVADAADQRELSDAVRSAVDDVLSDAIAFRPTLILLTHAAIVGDRLYIRLLLADKDGEQTFRDLGPGRETPETENTELQI